MYREESKFIDKVPSSVSSKTGDSTVNLLPAKKNSSFETSERYWIHFYCGLNLFQVKITSAENVSGTKVTSNSDLSET